MKDLPNDMTGFKPVVKGWRRRCCVSGSRRRRAELREVSAGGFGKKFFVIAETIGGAFRVSSAR
jgi:hypothetical protein